MSEPQQPEPSEAQRPPDDVDAATGDVSLADMPEVPLDRRLGITYVEASPDRVVARMPVDGNTQPFGLLHGGASCVLAESLGSIAATLYGRPDRFPVGVDINATHHRPVRHGHVTGVATPAHLGRSVVTYEVIIRDDDGQRTCTARITCLLRPVPAEPPQP